MPVEIRPLPGPQERFLACTADIAIYGGAAGGAKTYGLLLDGGRWLWKQNYAGLIFRRTFPQIMAPGGLWDTSMEIFSPLGLIPKQASTEWVNPATSSRLKFSHMQHVKNMHDWQGSQMAFIGFDELTHFTQEQFFYMISRNRSICGIRPYMRGTCNPDPDSWLRKFLSWWINEETGFPILERDGIVRWMAREGGETIWADNAQTLKANGLDPKSVTFIAANVTDNIVLMKRDPGYIASLKAMVSHERERLLNGNWNARAVAGSYFKGQMFEIVDEGPALFDAEVRYWDRAATEVSENAHDPDATAGVRMVVDRGVYYVMDVKTFKNGPGEVLKAIRNVASREPSCPIALEQDPGQAGKAEINFLISSLAGFEVYPVLVSKAKETRARPFAAQCQAGNVKLVRGKWNDAYIHELESFPSKKAHDDQVDASSGAFNELCKSVASTSSMSNF